MEVLNAQSVRVTFAQGGEGAAPHDACVHKKTLPCIIIAQAVEGHYEIQCGGSPSAVLEPGEAFLTAPGAPLVITHHFARQSGRMRMRWVHLNVSLFDSVDLSALVDFPVRMELPWAERIGCLASRMVAIQRGDSATSLLAAAQVNSLSFEVLSVLLDFLASKGRTPRFDPGMERLLPALEYARRHLADHIVVGDLARKAGLSVPRFHVEFKKHFGESPVDHLRKIRLSKASTLLRGTDLLLEEIASRTGFCSQFHFSREFKKAYGEPPSIYRRPDI